MLVISCLSQKGGVGKSTLARAIATVYVYAKWRVKIADFNLKQKTSTDWAAERMLFKIKPDVPAEAFSQVATALDQDTNYDLMVFDGRPDSHASTLDIARKSQLIVIPVGVSIDDLKPQVAFAHELRSKAIDKRRILFVINQSTESQVAVDDARDYVTSAGYTCAAVDLPMKTGYQMAQNAGKSIIETPFATLNDRAQAVVEEIVAALVKLTKEVKSV